MQHVAKWADGDAHYGMCVWSGGLQYNRIQEIAKSLQQMKEKAVHF